MTFVNFAPEGGTKVPKHPVYDLNIYFLIEFRLNTISNKNDLKRLNFS